MPGHRTGRHTRAARGESVASQTSQFRGSSVGLSATETRLIRPAFGLCHGLPGDQKGQERARRSGSPAQEAVSWRTDDELFPMCRAGRRVRTVSYRLCRMPEHPETRRIP